MAITLTSKIEAAGSRRIGGTMVMMFLFLVCGLLCVCLLSPARGGERREILKNLNEGFNTKKHQDSSFRRWFAGCLIFLFLHTKE
jgi:hypothetical protein